MIEKSSPELPANDNAGGATRKSGPCPICGRPSTETDAPFCSRRCADVDLHRWLGGTYRIPGNALDDDTEEGEGPSTSGE